MSEVNLILLGSPHLDVAGQPLKIDRRKAFAILAYLAITKRPQTREALATMFWPHLERKSGLNNLRRVLWSINQVTPDSIFESDRLSVTLKPIAVDVAQFQSHLSACSDHEINMAAPCATCIEHWEHAAGLYQDYFLAGLSLSDSPAFDTWQSNQTELLQQQFIELLGNLVRSLSATGAFDRALTYAQQWVLTAPADETAHQLVIQLYLRLGRRKAAEEQLVQCRQQLWDELGVEPSAETLALLSKRQPPQETLFKISKLPPLVSSIIGRKYEVDLLADQLRAPSQRLITLVGSGGIGKTTLALKVGHALRDSFKDGVVFVDLAKESADRSIIDILIETLSLQLFGQESVWEQLIQHIGEQSLLIIFDNFEHVVKQAIELPKLLHAIPQCKLLVTSRERLRLREEWVSEIGGLTFPSSNPPNIAAYDAVQLFLTRARQANSDYFATPDELAAIGQICNTVEGLPLAIELAATWVRSLSAVEILEELHESIDVLTHPYQNVERRHRSLRVIFDSSWNLLTTREQHIFRQLSVFHGPFDRQAARQICGANLPVLAALIDKSLLSRNENGSYQLTQVVQQYAAEKLAEYSQEKHATEMRHASWYLEQMTRQASVLRGNNPRQGRELVEAIASNFRAAWRWTLNYGSLEQLIPCLDVFSEFQDIRGRFDEAVRHFALASEFLRYTADAEPVRALLFAHEAYHHARLGMYDYATTLLQKALEFINESNATTFSFVLWQLGYINFMRGNYVTANDQLTTVQTMILEHNNLIGLARVHNTLGLVQAALGNYTESISLFETSIDYSSKIGYTRYRILATINLGNVVCILGDYKRGERLFEGNQILCHEIEDRYGCGNALLNLAELALVQDNAREAFRRYQDCLTVQRSINHLYGVANSLLGLGRAGRLLGIYPEALRYLQEALQLGQRIHSEPTVLESLISLAEIFAVTNRTESALMLAAHTVKYTSCDYETRQRAEVILGKARIELASKTFEANVQIGRNATQTQILLHAI